MQSKFLNKEERERAAQLNESIATLMRLHDDCIYALRDYFNEGLKLSKYIQLKADLAPSEEEFNRFRGVFTVFLQTENAMQDHVQSAQRLEVKLHQFIRQANRLLNHLQKAASAQERREIFAELESDTENMLMSIVLLKLRILQEVDLFLDLKKRMEMEDAN